MAGRAVIFRETTDADLKPLYDLCRKVWTQLGIPFDTSIDRFRDLKDTGFRIVVLYVGTDLQAALIAYPLETVQGKGYEIKTFVVNQDLQDKTRLLDALSLYAMNIGVSEGRRVVVSHHIKGVKGASYTRDMLGMDTSQGNDAYIYQIGHAPDMMRHILDRRPEWQLP
ncbi:hypothetical protein LCGC14_0662870 [marine sediment metagenome]|uniref:N-acetyltransferase domain-containing protein n=1 Tax=marine sediment metagenome TaxID=412755 RepID=A0A0F9RD73_9ZZZZ